MLFSNKGNEVNEIESSVSSVYLEETKDLELSFITKCISAVEKRG